MRRSTSIPACLLAGLCMVLTIYLFNVAEGPPHRDILLGLILCEGLAVSWLIWKLAQPTENKDAPPLPLPRSRPLEFIPSGSPASPRPRTPHQHRALQPTRPPARSSNPLPEPPTIPRRTIQLPAIPDLPVPQPGRSSPRDIEPTTRQNPARPQRQPISLDDLLPPAARTGPRNPVPSSVPTGPTPTPSSQGRPKRPSKYVDFDSESGNLPAKIALSELRLCCDILSLAYACAASDGPVSTDEEEHLQGWIWCVIENTSDAEAASMHEALRHASEQGKSRGKQKLESVAALADSIRSTGETKLIKAAAELCGEIVAHDGRLEPGEYATLSIALKGLGVRNVKASKIAVELLSGDDEITELMDELEITARTSAEERERKLSMEWSRQNARMQAVTDARKREEMRRRMELLQKIRDLYREIDRHG